MMLLDSYDASAGVFVRGLTNLKAQLTKAEGYAAANGVGEGALLGASLAPAPGESAAPHDLHAYSLAAHVHWAAEGARLAIDLVRGASKAPAPSDATTFAQLHQHLDATIAFLRELAPDDLEAGLEREITIEHRRGATRAIGRHFLVAFAIPHFFYHVTTAYGILRNQGVPLTMGDFLGNWGARSS